MKIVFGDHKQRINQQSRNINPLSTLTLRLWTVENSILTSEVRIGSTLVNLDILIVACHHEVYGRFRLAFYTSVRVRARKLV